jgi:hypothetical protein
MDYTDYYVVHGPAKFLGHDLQMIEQQYMATYVGCCVSPGTGITVRLHGSADNLHAFGGSLPLRAEPATQALRNPRGPTHPPFTVSAAIACNSRGSSAVTSGAKRATAWPLRSIRNFSKFQSTSSVAPGSMP